MHRGAQQEQCKTKNRALGNREHEKEPEAGGKIQENWKVSQEMRRIQCWKYERMENFQEGVGGKCNEGLGSDCKNEIERKDIGHYHVNW